VPGVGLSRLVEHGPTPGGCSLQGVAASSDGQPHEASLVYIVGRVDHGIRREMRARLAAWSLSIREYTTLSVLNARPGLSNAQLARRALVTPQSMIEILAKLEDRGLVKRRVDPSHRLILRAELTAAGKGVLAKADPAIHAIQEEMLAALPIRDREATIRGMTTAMKALSEGTGDGRAPTSRRARRTTGAKARPSS